jgi:hypothetical protein
MTNSCPDHQAQPVHFPKPFDSFEQVVTDKNGGFVSITFMESQGQNHATTRLDKKCVENLVSELRNALNDIE